MQTISNIPVTVKNQTLVFDAKKLIKDQFKYGHAILQKFNETFPEVNADVLPRNPVWVPIEYLTTLLERLDTAKRIADLDVKDFINKSKDWAFENGLTQYKSDLRLKEEAKVQALKEEQTQVGVNPVIRFLNDAWFPVIASTIFAIVIGSFSYEIFSDTIGMPPVLNFLLATIYVLFPVLTSISQYQFDIDGFKLSPLALVMVFDMIFTAYHVGWLRAEGYTPETEMHPVLKIAFIIIIPVMQKATNDMILKIRASYQRKGWLPSVI